MTDDGQADLSWRFLVYFFMKTTCNEVSQPSYKLIRCCIVYLMKLLISKWPSYKLASKIFLILLLCKKQSVTKFLISNCPTYKFIRYCIVYLFIKKICDRVFHFKNDLATSWQDLSRFVSLYKHFITNLFISKTT